MKIIQQGCDPDKHPIRATCRHCQTVFEFDRNEGRFTPDQRDGDFWAVGCPVCGRTVTAAA